MTLCQSSDLAEYFHAIPLFQDALECSGVHGADVVQADGLVTGEEFNHRARLRPECVKVTQSGSRYRPGAGRR